MSDHTTAADEPATDGHDTLLALLARATDREHGLAATMLFAASSLRNDVGEGGLTDGQADAARAWKRGLLLGARERLRGVAQLANLTIALSGPPRLAHPAPAPFGATESGRSSPVLLPFDPEALDRLAAGRGNPDPAADARPDGDAPSPANPYAAIRTAIEALPDAALSGVPTAAQATQHSLDFGGPLVAVGDRASALAALDTLAAGGAGGPASGNGQALAVVAAPPATGEAPSAAGNAPVASTSVPVAAGTAPSVSGQAPPAAGSGTSLGAAYAAAMEDARAAGIPFEPVRPVASNPTLRPAADGADVSADVGAGAGAARILDPSTRAVAALFVEACETFLLALQQTLASGDTPEAERDSLGGIATRLLDSAVRPLGEALARLPLGDASRPGLCAGPLFGDLWAAGAPPAAPTLAEIDARLWHLATAATILLATPGLPTEVAEAAAALQDLGCRLAPEDGPEDAQARLATLRSMQSGQEAAIRVSIDGPYLVTNVGTLTTWLGEPLPTRPQMALCRCGQSALKPFCDGAHARVDFTGRKDSRRVPDRRDEYPGTQLTVLDNRGTCAHSGFCTDRLKTVFHLGEDPFVVPNGARMDDVVRAVRACPSGALSYALDGVEIRDAVDQLRPPAIEVSKHGPYRVTGRMPMHDGHGGVEPRNAGASREHYSLCRCGHSQNKPFCSGMHWYVDFHDPAISADHQPTLFEWAGGLPALTRMTRLFYDKHVPEDPLLEPIFAHMSPDHPERVAAWLGEVFGGPKLYSTRHGGGTSQGGYRRMVSEHIGAGLTEEHRARWASLMAQSAGEAGLPTDPEFRAAFVAYIEWGSRLAVENSAPGAHPPMNMPIPHWDWVCNATPWGRVSALAPTPQQEQAVAALPAAGEPLHFEPHIKPLFRQTDRQSMTWAFDLWAYKDVAAHGPAILERLRAGSMPCDGAWSQDKVEVFARWVSAGTPE